jgi:hypothetical protein
MNAPHIASDPITLRQLAHEHAAAKAAEDEARRIRVAIEDRIATMMQGPAEGVVKELAEPFIISVTHKLTRAVDSDALGQQWECLNDKQRKCFRWSADVNLKQLRAVQDLCPEDYKAVAPFVTTKPAKPGVKIEREAA